MIYYVSLQALGDNLISLSFLEQLKDKANILGTKNTLNISELINKKDCFNIEIVFDDIPAFYDIRQKGIFRALKDLWIFVKYIKHHNIKHLIFEKNDFRSRLIALWTNTKIYNFKNGNKLVYENRQKMIEKAYGQEIAIDNYRLEVVNPKLIVINPLTRVELKNISHGDLEIILNELNNYEYEIYLIDREKKYQDFQNRVHSYLANTTLEDVKHLIIKADLYIGGDSFLIHLAYYLKRNYFMIFYRDSDDFLPPNIKEDFYIKAHLSDDFHRDIKLKFRDIGLIGNRQST